jgi:hypothetical protein
MQSTLSQNAFSRIRSDVSLGALSDGPVRYVLIRADGLMGAFTGPGQRVELASLCESVYQHGRKSLIQYQKEHGTDPGLMIAVVTQMAATLGWGVWHLRRLRADELALSVQNSPFAGAVGTSEIPVCAPVLGIVRAAGEILMNGAVRAIEHQCAACGADRCEFSVRLATRP